MTPTAPAATDKPLSWRDRLARLRKVRLLLRMIHESNPLLLWTIVLLRLVRSGIPLVLLWVSKLILDAIVGRLVRHTGSITHLWHLVLLEFGLAAAAGTLGRANALAGTILSDRFANLISARVMEHATRLDLCSFENPAIQDKLDRARRQSAGRLKLLVSLMDIWQDALSLAWYSAGLIVFSPWLIVFLTAAVIPVFAGESHFAALAYSILYRRTPARRFLEYLRFVGASAQSAKEVKIFGLGQYIVSLYKDAAKTLETENEALAIRGAVSGACLNLVSTAAYYACYAAVLARVLAGGVTVGTFFFLTAAFSRSNSCIERILSSFNEVAQEAMFLDDLFDFLAIAPSIVSPARPLPAPRPVRDGFEFRRVCFSYSGSDRPVLRDISFQLHRGEKIALLGENGAGKTTLVKLLTRLYDPTEGEILLDGIDLREYDIDDLRREISVIFQDYMRYDLTVRDNIGFGNIEFRTDDARLDSAAQKGFARAFIDRLPSRYDQILGKRFEGGADLSGGEWQKLALARSYMRDAQLMILDEPTAALDARSEFYAFQRFTECTRGRMALLISHRFSTVRMADRILVLAGGAIQEEGTHQHLVSQGGRYAELFELQAGGYR